MSDVTRILSQIGAGDPQGAGELLPLVYDELRKLAAVRMAEENPGTLQATALVHEAYLRLMDEQPDLGWDSRSHFFSAACEAMRRILVERARGKQRAKRGGGWKRIGMRNIELVDESQPELILATSEALEILAQDDPQVAELVKLRCFAGFSVPEAAKVLGLPTSTAYLRWEYAKARLRCLMDGRSS